MFIVFMPKGMEVLNRAIESIMHSRDRDEWEPIVIHVSDTVMSLWRGEVRVNTNQNYDFSLLVKLNTILLHTD